MISINMMIIVAIIDITTTLLRVANVKFSIPNQSKLPKIPPMIPPTSPPSKRYPIYLSIFMPHPPQ